MHLSDETREPSGQGYGGWERTEFKLREGYQASLVAQLVKNLPAMRTPGSGSWVRFLGQEDLLKKGEAIHSNILGLPWWLSW